MNLFQLQNSLFCLVSTAGGWNFSQKGKSSKYGSHTQAKSWFHFPLEWFTLLYQVRESIQLLADNNNPYKPLILKNFSKILDPKELGVKFVTKKGTKA